MFVHSKFIWRTLHHKDMTLGSGVFGVWVDHKGGALRLLCLYKKKKARCPFTLFPLHENTRRSQLSANQEVNPHQTSIWDSLVKLTVSGFSGRWMDSTVSIWQMFPLEKEIQGVATGPTISIKHRWYRPNQEHHSFQKTPWKVVNHPKLKIYCPLKLHPQSPTKHTYHAPGV